MAKSLIVDDSVFTRALLKNLLQALGHDTIGEAADVQPAIRAFQDLSPELVTLDIVMPSGTGLDVLKAIRQKNKNAKVIVVTASSQPGLDEQAFQLGANAILHKPFTAEEFRAKLLTIGSLGKGVAPAARAAAMTTLSREQVVAAAIEQAGGLQDWGADTSFWEGLDQLLSAAKNDGTIQAKDSVAVAYTLSTHLVNRLLIQDYVKHNPAVTDIPLRRPLVILGLPCTGDLFLHRLLAQDPSVRAFMRYEQEIPCFPSAAPGSEDPRLRIAKEYADLECLLDESMRKFRAQRPAQYDMPEPGFWLLANSFASRHLVFQYPGYQTWLSKQDMTAPYQYLRLQLQVLLSQKPCPPDGHVVIHDFVNHLANLEALLRTFPDANIVHTHRAVDESVAEWCNAVEAYRSIRANRVDPHEVGQFVVANFLSALTRGLAARTTSDPSRFIDIKYDDLRKDPSGTIKRINDRFGYPASSKLDVDGCLQTLRRPDKAQPLEHYGLTKEGLRERFAAYITQFGL